MSNKAKVNIDTLSVKRWPLTKLVLTGLFIYVESYTLPRRCNRTCFPQVYLFVPWAWLCRRIQSRTTDVQVRRPAMVQRHNQTELWDTVYKYLWRTEGEDDDAGISRKVSYRSVKTIFDC
jgi:hypothetical protein